MVRRSTFSLMSDLEILSELQSHIVHPHTWAILTRSKVEPNLDSLETNKRTSDDCVDESRLTKRLKRNDAENEKRLLPNYAQPRKAQAIPIPSSEDFVRKPPTAKKVAGTFRVVNTLRNEPNAALASRRLNSDMMDTSRSSHTTFERPRSRGGSAVFKLPPSRTSAKVHAKSPSNRNHQIDLTNEDEIEDTEIVAVNGNPRRQRSSISSHKAGNHSNYFGVNELRSVDSFTAVSSIRPKERNRDRPSSSTGPCSTESVASIRSPPSVLRGIRKSSSPASTHRPTSRNSEALLINLTKGFDDPPDLQRAKLRNTSPKASAVMHDNSDLTTTKNHMRISPRRTLQMASDRNRPSTADELKGVRPVPELGPSIFTFPPPPRSKASQNMKSISKTETSRRVSPIDEAGKSESGDELVGGPTIRSNIALANSSVAKRNQSLANREASPSDIVPTEFQAATRKVEIKEMPRAEAGSSWIRVAGFWSSRYTHDAGQDLLLAYDAAERSFKLKTRNGPVTLPGRTENIEYDTRTGKKCAQYSERIPQVILTGSSTPNHPGPVCIEFSSYTDVRWFLERFQSDTRSVQQELLSGTQFSKKFEHLKQQHERNQESKPEPTDRAKSEDRIIYENDDTIPESNNTRAPDTESTVADSPRRASTTKSRFFDDFKDVRRSTRNHVRRDPLSPIFQTPPKKKWTVESKPTRWPQSLVYPPGGSKRVTVDFQDLERLDEGEFLNDNVINFALRRIEDSMTERNTARVHLFNTFFYTALTTKNGRKMFNYDAVKRWTKNVDIFKTPYVVMPINIDLHWFVVIICNLPRLLKTGGNDEAPESSVLPIPDEDTVMTSRPQSPVLEVPADLSPAANNTIITADMEAEAIAGLKPELIAETPTNGDNDSVLSPIKIRNKKTRAPTPRKYDPESCVIVTLDSFGTSHASEIRHLKDYIAHEALEKRGVNIDMSDLQGMTAKGIPEQTNFCDCGLYVVGYVEEFAKDPDVFVRKVLARELDRANDFADFDPSKKREQIRNELLELQRQQESERQKARKQHKSLLKTQNVAKTETPLVPAVADEEKGADPD